MYSIAAARRAILEREVANWLVNPDLHEISVDVRAPSGQRAQRKVAEYTKQELSEMEAGGLLDLVVGEHGARGGKLQLRAVFVGGDGEPDYQHCRTRTFTLVREPGDRVTGSKGVDAALETGFRSLTANLDGFGRRLETAQGQTLDAVRESNLASSQGMERTLELVMAHQSELLESTIAVAELKSGILAERKLHEMQIRIIELERPGLGDAIVESLPALIASVGPLFQGAAGWLAAQARATNVRAMVAESQYQLATATPEPEPEPAEAPPIPTAEA